jgi:hypothetical protein
MDCQDIREKLSGYLDETLTPEERRSVKEHLGSCEPCRSALQDLEKTRDLLRNLEEVEPPPWMTPKIMSRVREEAERRKGIFQKFFYPLHIKVPIEALAMVFIAVIAVYVYRAVEPGIKQTGVSLPSPSPVIQEEKTEAGKGLSAPRPGDELPAAKRGQAPAERYEGYWKEKKAGRMADRRELAASQEASRGISKEEENGSMSPAGNEPGKQRGPAAASQMARPAIGKPGPYTIRLAVKNEAIARSQIAAILGQLDAQEINRATGGGKGEEVIAEVRKEKLKPFLQRLEQIGAIKEKDLPAKVPEGNIILHIEIVTAP